MTVIGTAKPKRLLALDVFRGMAVFGMIMVNNPGDPKTGYSWIEHTAWHGWTPADLVFPSFVFIMCVAVSLSLSRRGAEGQGNRKIVMHAARRALILFGLGMMFSINPAMTPMTYRVMGVLQRLAIVYFISTLIVIYASPRFWAAAAAALLAAYWAAMKLIPVPGYGAGDLSKAGNLSGYIDNILFKGHMWERHWDPEGLLSTAPAIAGGFIGCLAGRWLTSDKPLPEKIAGLMFAGSIFIAAAFILNPYFPINKNLWSPTFVLFASGIAMDILAACLWFVDFKGRGAWGKPFEVLGTNSLVAYMISGALMYGFGLLTVAKTASGAAISLKDLLFSHLFVSWAGPRAGSLLFSAAYAACWIAILAPLYRRKIFIKL
jgi:predicted acyltransferase